MIVNNLPFQRLTRLTRQMAILLLLMLSGCIQKHSTVHVARDGSGTIEQKLLFSGMLSEIMNNPGESGESGNEPFRPSEKQLKQMAAEFGPDVRAVDVRKVSKKEGNGYVATFAFDDIEKVCIGNAQQMNTNLSADTTAAKSDSTSIQKPETWFTFAMKRGTHPELVISKQSELYASSSRMSATGSGAKVGKKEQAQMLSMMSAFMKGLKMSVDVVVDGRVVKSDASYRVGNRITLYSIDFDKVMARPDLLNGKYDGLTDKEFARRSGKNSGLKFEFKDRISVLFN